MCEGFVFTTNWMINKEIMLHYSKIFLVYSIRSSVLDKQSLF
jgi:hypothetical protein